MQGRGPKFELELDHLSPKHTLITFLNTILYPSSLYPWPYLLLVQPWGYVRASDMDMRTVPWMRAQWAEVTSHMSTAAFPWPLPRGNWPSVLTIATCGGLWRGLYKDWPSGALPPVSDPDWKTWRPGTWRHTREEGYSWPSVGLHDDRAFKGPLGAFQRVRWS